MTRGTKNMIGVALAAVVVLFGTALAAWQLLQRPWYRPGAVRAAASAARWSGPGGPGPETSEWEIGPAIRLYHWARGSGRPVLVVHGGPGFPFRHPLAGLERACAGFRFHYYDQRGCGRSTRCFEPDRSRGFYANMRTLESALGLGAQIGDIERIRLLLREERLVLVGHSFGAFLAALYAAEFPERVAGLVLVSPADVLVLPAPGGDLFAQVRALLPRAKRPAYEAFLREYLDFRRLFERTDAETAALNARFAPFYAEAALTRGYRLNPEATGEPGGFMVQAQYLSMGRRHDYRSALRVVTAPVLIVQGRDDLQPDAAGRRYAEALPNARSVSVDGAGHFPFEEQPARFAEAVTPFLGELR